MRLPTRRSIGLATHGAALGGVVTALGIQASLLVTGILAARYLGPTDRGFLALVTLVPFIFGTLGTLGVPLSITYLVARSPSIIRSALRVSGRTLVLQSLILTPLATVTTYAVVGVARGTDVLVATAIAVAVVPAQLLLQYVVAVLQGGGRAQAFYFIRALPSILWMASLTGFAVVGRLGLVTATLSSTATTVASSAVGALMVRRLVRSTPHPHADSGAADLGWMVKFGLKGVFGSSPIITTYRLDQAIVGLILSPTVLGHYVVALSFTNLPRFVAVLIGSMAFPDTARERASGAARQVVWRYFAVTVTICGLIALAIWITAPLLVPFLFGREFESSVTMTRILLFSSVLVSAQRVLIEASRGLGRPGIGSLSELALLVTLLPAAALLISAVGVLGLPWALVVSSAVGFAVALVGVLAAPRPQITVTEARSETGVESPRSPISS